MNGEARFPAAQTFNKNEQKNMETVFMPHIVQSKFIS